MSQVLWAISRDPLAVTRPKLPQVIHPPTGLLSVFSGVPVRAPNYLRSIYKSTTTLICSESNGSHNLMDSNKLVSQMAALLDSVSRYQQETDKKFEQLSVRNTLHLQSINLRLTHLEAIFNDLKDEFTTIKNQSSGTMQRKIELIGKHMADLSSDISRLSDVNPNLKIDSMGLQSQNDSISTALVVEEAQVQAHRKARQEVEAEAHRQVQQAQVENQRVDQQAQVEADAQVDAEAAAAQVMAQEVGSDTLSTMASVHSSSSNGFERSLDIRPLVNNVPSYGDNSFMDINKQWSKALGIRSPAVGSPLTPKFEYPIPINRALSFNRQLVMDTNLVAANAANASALSAIGANTPSVGLENNTVLPLAIDSLKRNNLSLVNDVEKSVVDDFNLMNNSISEPYRRQNQSKSTTNDTGGHNKRQHTSEFPQYKLEKGARNVGEIWQEYEYGVNGKPPLKDLEEKYAAKWRNDTESRTFVRRKKIYSAIEKGLSLGLTEKQVVDELENLRTYTHNGAIRKRPMSWLYTNIPEKYR